MRALLSLLSALLLACGSDSSAPDDGGSAPPDASDGSRVDPPDLGEPVVADFVAALADPLAPARRLPGRVFLRSSRVPEPASGNANLDRNEFISEEEGVALLADEVGPGVITRLWLTFGGTGDDTVGDRIRAFIHVDGEELDLDGDGEPGVPLGVLTAGELEGFPQPWVLGRAEASGSLLVQLPIHYQRSFRFAVDRTEAAAGWTYYQVSGRAMPPGVTVPPFDRAALAAAAARATELWVDEREEGATASVEPSPLAPEEAHAIELDGPGAITLIEVVAPMEARAELTLRVSSDDEVALDAPLPWATGSAEPAEPYASAFLAADVERARLAYPIPFGEEARVELVQEGESDAAIGLRVVSVEGPAPGGDLGRFMASCEESFVDIEESICSQNPEVQYENVVVGTFEGRGQYAGQSFRVDVPPKWWWMLEADHEIAVDGEYAMLGTGTEDYFGGAFYFINGPYSSPLSGAPGYVRPGDDSMRIQLFRHHLVDTVPFERELRFEYESYVDQTRWRGCIFGYGFEE